MDDGFALLTGSRVGSLLRAAVAHSGGTLEHWELDHVDANPEQSTTATYLADVSWPFGRRPELLGVSARTGPLAPSDANAQIFEAGGRKVAVWLYPNDPDLPGLVRATYPDRLAELLNEQRILPRAVKAEDLAVSMVGYRPRRRAVVKVEVATGQTLYIKVLRPRTFTDVLNKHLMLADSPVPGPEVAFATDDHLMALWQMPGRPMANAIFEEDNPCTAEDLVRILDAMPPSVAALERRPPWTDAVRHYGNMVATALPEAERQLQWAADQITAGLANCPVGYEATHGDYHEGQIHVRRGQIVGLLDVDTIGPGRRADDLACMVAHLSTIQRMTPEQKAKLESLLRVWVPVFDTRVDPVELRLRAAAVIISLATGPHRSQEEDWQATTWQMIRSAIALIRQVA